MKGHQKKHDDLSILGIAGFSYADLYEPSRLRDLTLVFDRAVQEKDPDLFEEFQTYRNCNGEGMSPGHISGLLVKMAPLVGEFIAWLFHVEASRCEQMHSAHGEFEGIFTYRNDVVGKLAARYKGQNPHDWDIKGIRSQFDALLRALIPAALVDVDQEAAVAKLAAELLSLSKSETPAADSIRNGLDGNPKAKALFADALAQDDKALITALFDCVCRWSFAAANIADLKVEVADWVSFKIPMKTDFNHLVAHETVERNGYKAWAIHPDHQRRRQGFALTDPRFGERRVLYEVDHCIYCHDRDTDSCSKGMRNKKDGTYKTNPLGVTITGCPLEEKISEMHVLKRQGDNIAALALVIIDNPMCPGTGHRICNECMKGCIYQKTEPVNIPQIETHVLTSVLFMPWGFEIYSLLTRWNPLNVKRPHALPYNGKNVLVTGMGPSGYTLSHYLLNEGFGVVGIDGLKIEPLPKELTGDGKNPPKPILDFNELYEELDKRVMLGFGGVAEYGITVRWDKNFLKVIYLNLLRRKAFRCYGGVRFGGTLTINEAWDVGFHHIAIASGAGKPTVIDLKNNLTRGIRKASDFLMALQLTGAAKESSLANLQVRLPAGVIGGGLTAIDTTTELLAYYPVQVEKILNRYEKLKELFGEDMIRSRYDVEEIGILDEFLAHGKAIQDERQRAESVGEKPHFVPLLEQWGGVTLFYRKGIKDSPAYRQNHEEIAEALDEGIRLAEGMSPVEALDDEYGHLRGVRFETLEERDGRWRNSGELEVPLRSLFVAAGTSPNTIYESEHPESFVMDKKFYQRHELDWTAQPSPNPEGEASTTSAIGENVSKGAKQGTSEPQLILMTGATGPKLGKPAPFTSYHRKGRYITFYGDNHPVYAGNVVKAMASAKDGYPYIVKLFQQELANLPPDLQAERDQDLAEFQSRLDADLLARIVEIRRLTPTIIEVIVKAPQSAKHFLPGQFYRVQNFESLAPVVQGTVLTTEGLALTGAWVDKERGLISLIALEMGSSSRLCATWNPGDPIVVMGVTGTPTDIPRGRTVMLLGGGLGNAVLFSIGKAMRAAGNQVIYFAGYRNRIDVFKVEEIEAAADLIVWSVDRREDNTAIELTRPQDKTFIGNIVESIVAYAKGELGETPIHLDDVDHLIVIGSDRMMDAVKQARYGILKPYLKEHHEAIGSINSPMQCMMKGVCAQCLCKHIDPDTGREYFVYSCNNQDQDLNRVDFPNLRARLKQNSVQEKLSSLWLDYLLGKTSLEG